MQPPKIEKESEETGQNRKRKLSMASKSPINKLKQVNQKCFNEKRRMNNLLIKILERYELDRPIMMHDKIDVIWDKKKVPEPPKPEPILTADEEFEKILAELRGHEEKHETESAIARRKEEKNNRKFEEDNVNHYAVKFKLEKKKIQRAQTNAK